MNTKKTIVATEETLKHPSHNVIVFKKKMLVWNSPVEYVNNMYGCHPDEMRKEYFDVVYDGTRV